MAKFKLFLLNLTNTNESNIRFTPSIISEFYSQDVLQNSNIQTDFSDQYNTYCYSFNESVELHSNAQKTLTFKMEKMILKDNEWVENPYTRMMLPGTQLCLIDNFDNQYLFTITSVKYDFKETNVIYEISCQDSFSQQLSTQNDGYEIVNDPTKTTFIGAKTIDFWANKIVQECYIPYLYVSLQDGLYLVEHKDGSQELVSTYVNTDRVLKTYKKPYAQSDYPEYYDLIPFSASGNANSVLIELGNQIDFMLNTCEFSENQHTYQRYFWFEPKKHEEESGLLYSPYNSIKSFGLTHNGKSLTTILNVTGSSQNNKIVSLLPSVPQYFLQLFNSADWEQLNYAPGMFSQVIYHKLQEYNNQWHTDLRVWHSDDYATYMSTYQNIVPTEISFNNLIVDDPLDYLVYKNSNGSALPFLYLPLTTADNKVFYFPGYDRYSLQWENHVSAFTFKENGENPDTYTLNAIDDDFQLCNITNRKWYEYKVDDDAQQDGITSPATTQTILDLPCCILEDGELQETSLKFDYQFNPAIPPVTVPISVSSADREKTLNLPAWNGSHLMNKDVTLKFHFINNTSTPTVNVNLLTIPTGSSDTVTLYFSRELTEPKVVSISNWLFFSSTSTIWSVYQVVNNEKKYLGKATGSWSGSQAESAPDAQWARLTQIEAVCTYGVGATSESMSCWLNGREYEMDKDLTNSKWYVNPDDNMPSFYLDVQKDVVGCHLTGTPAIQTLQEILITEDNLQDYKYKNIKTEDNNTNQIFLRMQWRDNSLKAEGYSFDIEKESLYLDWLRIPIQEEIDFANIADQIPWLENKLIDFTYFLNHNLINKQQYSELQNTINNTLRLVNGKLLFYTNAYYNALHYQTTEMANLLNSLEGLSAIFNSQVIKAYENHGVVSNIQQFDNSYNTIFQSTSFFNTKHELLNYDNIYSDYLNKYISAQQRFLKNIYYFKQYFEENISIFRPNSAICEDKLSITNTSDDTIYTFKQQNNLWNLLTNSFKLFNSQQTPLVQIYSKEENQYFPVEVVDANNYKQFNYAQIQAEDNYTLINESNSELYNINNVYYKAWKIDSAYNDVVKNLNNIEQLQWIKETPTEIIKGQIVEKTYRYWKIILVGEDFYTYPIAPWVSEEVPNDLYLLNDPAIIVQIDSNESIYLTATLKQIRQAYSFLLGLQLANNLSRYYDVNAGTKPTLDSWYIRDPQIYLPIDNLLFNGADVWTYTNNKWTFSNPWFIPCYWSDDNWLNLIQQWNTKEFYLKNLPLNSLYIYTHNYKVVDSKITIVNNKDESFSQWYISTFKDKTIDSLISDITPEEWNTEGNPYRYYVYQEIPLVTSQNYQQYAHKPFPQYSWLHNIHPSAWQTMGIFLGLPITATGLAIASQTKWGDNFYDNANYSDESETFKHPGQIIYSTELTEPLKETYRNGVSKEYTTSQEWVQDALTETKPDLGTKIDTLDTWMWDNLEFDNNQWEGIPIPDCNFISFYKYYHHTYGTLLEYLRNGHQQIYQNSGDQYPDTYDSQPLLFKDTKCVLLKGENMLSTSDTYYVIPIGGANDFTPMNVWEELDKIDLFVQTVVDAGSGKIKIDPVAYLNKVCFNETDVDGETPRYYFSRIACYPWMTVADKFIPSTNMTVLDYLINKYSVVTQLGSTIPYFQITSNSRSYYCVVVREENYLKQALNIGNLEKTQYFYNQATDLKINWNTVQNVGWGYYYHDNQDKNIVSASELHSFDDTKHYYKNNQRYYTLSQLCQLRSFYYIDNDTYIEMNLSADKLQYKGIELYKYKKILENNVIKGLEYDSSIKIDLSVPSVDSKLSRSGYTAQYEDFSLTIKTTIQKPLTNVSNGQFWYDYHSETQYPTLFEYAAAIETKLQEYWSIAYNASLFCEYFIPANWQISTNGTRNYFTEQLYVINNNKITLSNNLPKVVILQDEFGNTQLPSYTFKYNSKATCDSSSIQNIVSSNSVLQDLTNVFGPNFWTNISAQENDTTTTYFKGYGGWIKPNIVLNKDMSKYTKFGGIYQMILVYLQEHYIDKPLDNYTIYKNKHDAIWRELYQKYPSILMEGKYENTDATTSADLMTMAKYAFKDLSRPEREYNISIINNLKDFINYTGQELHIGDPIQVASREFYDQFDDIRISLDQLLFISDIKYNLREDNNISITVNAIKYQDKLIQRLVKLIK